MELKLYNTLAKIGEPQTFVPIDPKNVRMYVCGPTVYDFAHIGNARPVIVFDVLFRLLRREYGARNVTYVRNITDVDDKINARAAHEFPELDLNEAIRKVTQRTERQFQADVRELRCREPTFEPRATDFVLPRVDGKTDMVTLIERLIDRGHAYEAAGEVLFDTQSMPDYGALSGRKLNEQQAGARVAVDAHKRNPTDFVLWKQSTGDEPGWESPWGRGRPGWHIECSAMSAAYLGDVFDIHGGGIDLIFPHHENEIAQSRCAHGTQVMANYWMHNGFLEVESQKMSKSLGNFVTIRDLLKTKRFGGKQWSGEVVRFAMLSTHYRQPIDWTVSLLEQSATRLGNWKAFASERIRSQRNAGLFENVISALFDDLNTPRAFSLVDEVVGSAEPTDRDRYTVGIVLSLLGFTRPHSRTYKFVHDLRILSDHFSRFSPSSWKSIGESARETPLASNGEPRLASELIAYVLALSEVTDELRRTFDPPEWTVEQLKSEFVGKLRNNHVRDLIRARTAARARKDFDESDKIRDQLAEMGVVVKDSKDGPTWEVVR